MTGQAAAGELQPPTGRAHVPTEGQRPTILEAASGFGQLVHAQHPDVFNPLVDRHQPRALFVGCSDARVVPELITGGRPGELFVIRTAGNIVPTWDAGSADGVLASIEYAVEVRHVPEIIICGHTGCGAMTARFDDADLHAMPAVASWLAHAPEPNAGSSLDELIRRNALRQAANVASISFVSAALTDDLLTISAWIYDLATGGIEVLNLPTHLGKDISMTHALLDPEARHDLANRVVAAKIERDLTWRTIAEPTGLSVEFVTAALLGQHPLPADAAAAVSATLGLTDVDTGLLTAIPYRETAAGRVPVDPTLYRFYEMLNVYGTTLKALIHEDFGDGIISAINFRLKIDKVEDPDGGSRAIITLDGKYLPTRPF